MPNKEYIRRRPQYLVRYIAGLEAGHRARMDKLRAALAALAALAYVLGILTGNPWWFAVSLTFLVCVMIVQFAGEKI